MKYIALAGAPYVGKTTIARALGELGYRRINFSEMLKQKAAFALSAVTGDAITATTINQNKAKYRTFLQELGDVIGFNDQARYVRDVLDPWHYDGCPPAVFDCVRTVAQWTVLREYGFRLVNLYVPYEVHIQRAKLCGMRSDDLDRILECPLEQGLPDLGIQVESSGKMTAEFLAHYGAEE